MKSVRALQDCLMMFFGCLATVLALATMGKAIGTFSAEPDLPPKADP